NPRQMPAAEEQDYHKKTGGNQMNVFAQHEERELEAAELRVISADKLLFRFWQIEWQSVAFRQYAREEKDESKRLIQDEPPGMNLPVDDALGVQRSCQQHDRDCGHAQRDFVTHQLRARPQPAQKAVFIV